ncbi:MAG TPA: SDR family NAD(P)-dependent oxidoreductase [Dehalococcoidia bacterium]|nr:SDR family NAD(P)-dependent oxidoreductase [Dehalococcoidia bacterium]
MPVACDVSSIDDLNAMCEKTLEVYGEVNILINNAGVMTRSELAKSSIGDWEWIFAVNLFGVVRGIEVFLPHLLSASGLYGWTSSKIRGWPSDL